MTNEATAPSRGIYKRIVVSGDLMLLSPTALGNGDAEALTDMPLLLDTAGDEPLPLLTGSSVAGALRNFLHQYDQGYGHAEQKGQQSLTTQLFGAVKGDTGDSDANDPGGEQSALIIDDALAPDATQAEVRDGVRIDSASRTAQDKFKYDLELLPAGVVFPLRFELLLSDPTNEAQMLHALALALHGFETEQIAIGGRKTRGFGRCVVREWQMTEYDLRTRDGLLAWLTADYPDWNMGTARTSHGTAMKLLVAEDSSLPADRRRLFQITLACQLESPMLIRSEEGSGDVSHLQNSQEQPIMPGTSLAGVLRARAERIIRTIDTTFDLNSFFGRDMHLEKGNPSASRVIVRESAIEHGTAFVQPRVAIDRFTGGALDTALFSEAPQLNGDVVLHIAIRNPAPAEKGLLLLLVKDIWTGDLPIGGTSSIGRGRLRGLSATIDDEGASYALARHGDDGLTVSDEARQVFEGYVQALQSRKES